MCMYNTICVNGTAAAILKLQERFPSRRHPRSSVTTLLNGCSSKCGVVKLNVSVDNDDVLVSLRGYMILKEDETGNLVTYYTGMAEGSYASVNGN